ncbi:ribosomal large subunit pseudouridine synthase D [Filimonas sp.]|jgi:23S rRNA pseudouridine955/2504/2580 synthase/23S rRNA pseudouridine1911/1915/1917 synthase|nr:ribosomal large subunit pseudouridine synthase D [Filimonas sp.]
MKPDILYEDDHYIIVNKPSGLLSIPDRHNAAIPSVTGILRDLYPSVFIIHRLDKDTSGILCFAKDEETHRYTSQLFEHREVKKNYIGIVHGNLAEESGIIEDAIMEHPVIKGKMIIHQKQGKPSITKFEVLESFGLYSFVKFDILTGRTHQIRVHMQNYGHPIVCDPVYGKPDPVFISQLKKKFKLSKDDEEEKPILNRLALHAFRLCFVDAGGKTIDIEAPLPRDMNAMLKQCRKWMKK